jgi:hypothetical protein
MDRHRTAERRSLAYHGAIARRLAKEPQLVDKARERVEQWCTTRGVHPTYVTAWRQLLRGTPAEIAAALIDESEHMTALRQVSPFAGALDARTRWQLWRSVG